MQIHPGLKINSSKIQELTSLLSAINTADDFFNTITALKSKEEQMSEAKIKAQQEASSEKMANLVKSYSSNITSLNGSSSGPMYVREE